ncbi:hypothetical protein [Burkholderia cepacia]|uniref:hypothetical protein n=1 Tax=Burkholderia cepacia TaxID=292 RepID=UPI001FC8A269|nr:hypothetical protein [Burkholderia cepacia]
MLDTTGRTLTHAQWQYVLQTVLRPQSTFYRAFEVAGEPAANAATTARDGFLLLFAYTTGLRRADLAAATTGALTRTALDGALDDAWSLRVMGKGRRARTVPPPHRLIDILRAELRGRPVPLTLETGPRRHAADRAPCHRPAAAPGRGGLGVQGDFYAGRRPAGDRRSECGR